ncbi:MAG: type II secretion system GspH family protein [Acidobacteriota bacterium]|nr:type II secretion system GspH family protein [Acidobacteriota bacterium]
MKTTTIQTGKTIFDFRFSIFDKKRNNRKSKIENRKSTQRGAALVSLMALMTIMGFLMLAAAPSILMDVQRSKEEEAIARGEEIAEAIRIYVQRTGRFPQRMEELLEGVPVRGSTKKLMILRPSAAIDPLSSTGEWKTIQTNEIKTINEFQRKLVNYTGSNIFSNPPSPNNIFDRIAGQVISSINTETDEDTEAPGGEDSSQNVDGPFVAVVSRSQRKSVITYYGIERHDRWIFTPLFRGTGNQGGFRGGPPPPPAPPPPIPRSN